MLRGYVCEGKSWYVLKPGRAGEAGVSNGEWREEGVRKFVGVLVLYVSISVYVCYDVLCMFWVQY